MATGTMAAFGGETAAEGTLDGMEGDEPENGVPLVVVFAGMGDRTRVEGLETGEVKAGSCR